MITYDFNAEKATNEIVEWIREWFNNNGKDCNAVIGISGGKDSSVAAALCVKALGKDRVIGVLMPNGHQLDIEDSFDIVQTLDIKHLFINISNSINSIYGGISNSNKNKENMFIEISDQTKINLPARIRMTTLYAVSQSVNGRVANTCNLSEDWIGYSTRWGDSVGDFCPIANLTTEEVVEVGKYLGLPINLIEKVPADGLCDKTDEENLGFSYEVLNKYIRTGICEDAEIKKKIDDMHNRNNFKMYMPPSCGVWELVNMLAI